MTQDSSIGVLAVYGPEGSRLWPMIFSQVDGEWWTATSRQHTDDFIHADHVDILLMDDTFANTRVSGTLEESRAPDDRRRLWGIQSPYLARWCDGVEDPNLVVLKVHPLTTT